MSEVLSNRIDEFHKCFDDLGSDMDKRFGDLRADMDIRFNDLPELRARLSALDQRLDVSTRNSTKRPDESTPSFTKPFDDIHQTLRTFMWVVSGWVMFLTAVVAVFGFLRR